MLGTYGTTESTEVFYRFVPGLGFQMKHGQLVVNKTRLFGIVGARSWTYSVASPRPELILRREATDDRKVDANWSYIRFVLRGET